MTTSLDSGMVYIGVRHYVSLTRPNVHRPFTSFLKQGTSKMDQGAGSLY